MTTSIYTVFSGKCKPHLTKIEKMSSLLCIAKKRVDFGGTFWVGKNKN